MGSLESAVMSQLWAADEPMTVRAVHENLSPDRTLAYTTVMTVLDRLATKGLATRERQGRAYTYTPSRSREELTAELMLDALGGNEDPADRVAALQHFVGRISPREAEAIRAALPQPE